MNETSTATAIHTAAPRQADDYLELEEGYILRILQAAFGERGAEHRMRVREAIDRGIAHLVYDGSVPASVVGAYIGAASLHRAWLGRSQDLPATVYRARGDVRDWEDGLGLSSLWRGLASAELATDLAMYLAALCRAYRADPTTLLGEVEDVADDSATVANLLCELQELGS